MADEQQSTEQMTEDQNTVEEATEAQESTPEATEAPADQGAENGAESSAEDDQQHEQDEQPNPNAEAKRYRLRLRETEVELTEARAAVEALQDQVLSSTLAEGIDVIPTQGNIVQNPDGTPKPRTVSLNHESDLWTVGGVNKSDMLTDGVPDRAKLSEAVGKLYNDRPELFREGRPGDPIHQPIPSAGREPDSYAALKSSGGWQGVIQNR